MKIALIGVGNLGSALAESLLRTNVTAADDLFLAERNENQHASLRARFCARVSARAEESLREAEAVILAVKPQDAPATCAELSPHVLPTMLVISVMAGIPLDRLSRLLSGHPNIVRAMPNLGARTGASATVYMCNGQVSESDAAVAEQIVSSFGQAWRVYDEQLVDAATAIAGSGPAYVCWFAEQMESVARSLGFAPEVAQALVLQTLVGTVQYVSQHPVSFSELRTQVTSPNGTTAAALDVLASSAGDVLVRTAIEAAFTRARELAQS